MELVTRGAWRLLIMSCNTSQVPDHELLVVKCLSKGDFDVKVKLLSINVA